MNEIEEAIRTVARNLGKHSKASLVAIVDADGAFVYEFAQPEDLANQVSALSAFSSVLKRREDTRAKTFGTGS